MEKQRRLHPSIATLMAFDAVAKTENFTQAAQKLNLTQSAVSRQISALEEQLGCKLFDRNSRNVALTPIGRAYAVDISQALKLIQSASQKIVNENNETRLNLGILPTFGTRWLMPRIPRFVDLNPEITVSFTSHIGEVDFSKSDLDAAIIHGEPVSKDIEYTFLIHETVVPVASNTLISNARDVTAFDISNLPLLHIHSRPAAWANWFHAQGYPPPRHGGAIFEHFSSLSQACIGGMGIALMPKFLIKQELEDGDLKIVGDSWQDETAYYFAQPKTPQKSTTAAIFRNWLKEDMQLYSS